VSTIKAATAKKKTLERGKVIKAISYSALRKGGIAKEKVKPPPEVSIASCHPNRARKVPAKIILKTLKVTTTRELA